MRYLINMNSSILSTLSAALIAGGCTQPTEPQTPAQPPPLAQQDQESDYQSPTQPGAQPGYGQASEGLSPQPSNTPPEGGEAPPGAPGMTASPPNQHAAESSHSSPGGQETSGASRTTEAAASVDDRTIDAFARSYLQIAQLQQQYDQVVRQATDQSQIEAAQSQTNQRALAIIEEEDDLTLEQFQQIQLHIERDPQLRERVEASVRELNR